MRLKSTLLAATLTAFAASATYADEDYPEDEYVWKGEAQTLKTPKPAKKRRHAVAKKIATPEADSDRQATAKDAAAKEAQAKEKQEKEGCEKTLTC